jgi:hypothetical protein
MGRGPRQQGAITAQNLLFGERPVKKRKVRKLATRQKFRAFNFSPRRVGLEGDGVMHGSQWFGTRYWAVRDPDLVTEHLGQEILEKESFDIAVKKSMKGQLIDIELDTISDNGSGQSTPKNPRYERKVKGNLMKPLSVNADFAHIIELSNKSGAGYWQLNLNNNILLYYNQNNLMVGMVMPINRN